MKQVIAGAVFLALLVFSLSRPAQAAEAAEIRANLKQQVRSELEQIVPRTQNELTALAEQRQEQMSALQRRRDELAAAAPTAALQTERINLANRHAAVISRRLTAVLARDLFLTDKIERRINQLTAAGVKVKLTADFEALAAKEEQLLTDITAAKQSLAQLSGSTDRPARLAEATRQVQAVLAQNRQILDGYAAIVSQLPQ